MNGLPVEMIDRWQDRPEPAPGEGLIYWHMLVGTDPDVIALACEARRKLAPFTGLHLLPKKVRRGPILAHRTSLGRLPQLVSWPDDGGAFVTLPQVYTEDPDRPGLAKSNLGMYRVQISGNRYEPDREAGLHYQIHRGIGVHQDRKSVV